MKRYIKSTTESHSVVVIETPYSTYEFDSETEADEFESYVNSDPEYNDPEIGDIVEHCFFINKGLESL